jgi:hypothetical protein
VVLLEGCEHVAHLVVYDFKVVLPMCGRSAVQPEDVVAVINLYELPEAMQVLEGEAMRERQTRDGEGRRLLLGGPAVLVRRNDEEVHIEHTEAVGVWRGGAQGRALGFLDGGVIMKKQFLTSVRSAVSA